MHEDQPFKQLEISMLSYLFSIQQVELSPQQSATLLNDSTLTESTSILLSEFENARRWEHSKEAIRRMMPRLVQLEKMARIPRIRDRALAQKTDIYSQISAINAALKAISRAKAVALGQKRLEAALTNLHLKTAVWCICTILDCYHESQQFAHILGISDTLSNWFRRRMDWEYSRFSKFMAKS